jgi:hypothetical protein
MAVHTILRHSARQRRTSLRVVYRSMQPDTCNAFFDFRSNGKESFRVRMAFGERGTATSGEENGGTCYGIRCIAQTQRPRQNDGAKSAALRAGKGDSTPGADERKLVGTLVRVNK